MRPLILTAAAVLIAGCGPAEINTQKKAEMAWFGLDGAVTRAVQLGFAGFNAATSANIATQSQGGAVSGTLSVAGQVDQGASANKTMRLTLSLSDYADVSDLNPNHDPVVKVTYDTTAAIAPTLDVQLKDSPNGTLEGALAGDVRLKGDMSGTATLALTLSGTTEADPTDATKVLRVPGGTHVTGTVTADNGTSFNVNVTH